MKRCMNCQRDFGDNMMFCPTCGSTLAPVTTQQMQICPSCGTQNMPGIGVCKKCGFSFANTAQFMSQSMGNSQGVYQNISMPGSGPGNIAPGPAMNPGMNNPAKLKEPKESGNNSLLIGIVAALVVVLVVVVVIVAVGMSGGSKETSKESQNTASEEGTDNDEADISEYQDYYDQVDEIFGKLIVSDEKSGQISTYKEALKDAIKDENEDNCKYNYDKLKGMEKSLTKSSKSKIASLKKKIKEWENKSTSKTAKNETEYKKNKGLAEDEQSTGNYSKAKTYYEACLDSLKKAKKESQKSSSNSGNNSSSSGGSDSWYTNGARDDATYNEVYNNYLDSDYVASMSNEQKRYYMNTLFAAYGYRFNNSTIQKYFNGQTWYSPDTSVAPGDQTAIKSKFDSMCEYNYNLLKG